MKDPVNLTITDSALRQLQLLQQHDYTLEGMSFRIKIGGKGCGGFTYETGFSLPLPDDLILTVQGSQVLMDPFTAFYSREARLDYVLDLTQDEEGFVVENFAGDRYKGKFFKDSNLVPSWDRP